jgi:acetylcholinesterase
MRRLSLCPPFLQPQHSIIESQPQAIVANHSVAAGIPTWRYYFNATFPNTQPPFTSALGMSLAAFHSSEIPMVFSTYLQTGTTAQEFALSNYMRGAWAEFARNPTSGPGWNALGTFGGTGLGVLGTNGRSGVTVIRESVVDGRCAILQPIYPFLSGT